MARTKRKVNPLVPVAEQAIPQQRIYNAAGYARLSVEDSGRHDADTIEAQKELIESYIASQPDMNLYGLYCDNGRTGTNFQRPEFERLMEDVRTGQIDCIVVKDLSRFGRNYKETGNYLERIFPFLDVRFVAVNDNFDTLTAERSNDGYIVPLKNIINEAYSKDISRKSGSALAVKQKAGKFIGSWAAYGYRKCIADKHKIEPDPATAPIVKDIFAWRLGGMSYNKIAKRLNDEGVPSPAQYLHQIGIIATDRYDKARWSGPVIRNLTGSEVYLGHMVQGRKKSGLSRGLKQQLVPKQDWVIVENTHEPLIDEGTFLAVQEMAKQVSKTYYARLGSHDHLGTTPNILRGLVFCADCGRPLVRYKSVTNKGRNRYYVFICPTHSADITACPKKYIHETQLIDTLWCTLQHEIALAGDMKTQAEKYTHAPSVIRQQNSFERQIVSAKQTLLRSKALYDSLYQNYVDHLMDEREYMELKAKYRTDMDAAQGRIDALEREKSEQKQQTVDNPWLKSFSAFTNENRLTEGMTHALIQRVEVYSDNRVEITLKYRDEYHTLKSLIDGAEGAVGS